jgi:DNA-binding transcriptional ArsR family regulator
MGLVRVAMVGSMTVAMQEHFVYDQSMNAEQSDLVISRIAAAMGEPTRVRILYCLLDGHARTSTELAMVADVSPSTTSVHLTRLKNEQLVKVFSQGKHRYYSLEGPDVGAALEALHVLAGGSRDNFVPSTPSRLLAARTCYDHMAGRLGVFLHNRFIEMGWLCVSSTGEDNAYDLTPGGTKAFEALGIDLASTRLLRRRFAYPCLDWSERQPHIGGALGAALLKTALKRKWVIRELDSRALNITSVGRREVLNRFGLHL